MYAVGVALPPALLAALVHQLREPGLPLVVGDPVKPHQRDDVGHPRDAFAVLETAGLGRGTVELTGHLGQLEVRPAAQLAQLDAQAPPRASGSLRSGHPSAARPKSSRAIAQATTEDSGGRKCRGEGSPSEGVEAPGLHRLQKLGPLTCGDNAERVGREAAAEGDAAVREARGLHTVANAAELSPHELEFAPRTTHGPPFRCTIG